MIKIFRYVSECSVSGDPRGKPDRMNNEAGSHLNIFTTMTFNKNGFVTKFDYYGSGTGTMFLSFWYKEDRRSHRFKMRGKIQFETYIGYQVSWWIYRSWHIHIVSSSVAYFLSTLKMQSVLNILILPTLIFFRSN